MEVEMENVDIFNKRREKLENIRERGKLEKNEYSISVHVWLSEDDKLWIQQRSMKRRYFPDYGNNQVRRYKW